MNAFDVVIVGGGIAGLSALLPLSAQARVLLLEREPELCAQASGRNAAIFRPLEHDATTLALARRSLALFAELGGEPVLARSGLLFASATPEPLARLRQHARAQGIATEPLARAELYRLASSLEGGDVEAGLFVAEGGVLDIDAMARALSRAARARGGEIRCGAGAVRVQVAQARVLGVELPGGERIAAGKVVLAAGAWSAAFGQACGAPLPLAPLRRHLIELEGVALPAEHPVVWRVDEELYYRATPAGVLASPCDEIPALPAAREPADPARFASTLQALSRTAPSLSAARVREAWSCLRTFTPDRELCVGEDPRVRGLYWFAGLGGRGMAVAPAAGEVLAALADARPHALAAAFAPARCLSG